LLMNLSGYFIPF